MELLIEEKTENIWELSLAQDSKIASTELTDLDQKQKEVIKMMVKATNALFNTFDCLSEN